LLSILIYSPLSNSGFKPVFVIPHEKERENVEEIIYNEDIGILFITTPGQASVVFQSFSYKS
jgi:hypothetical protein